MSKTRDIIISSGNVLNKAITIRKGADSASEELYETLKSCLESQKELDISPFSNGNSLEILGDQGLAQTEERDELKVTLKLFLYNLIPSEIEAVINRGLEHTSVNYVDTLVLSFSDQSETTRITLDKIKDTWAVIEECVKNNTVKMIGICDVDTQVFIQLYTWARVKPSIVQINLASCCVVPPELAEFCKENSIQLLTHSDPINILPEVKLGELMKPIEKVLSSPTAENPIQSFAWESKWVLRYQIHLKSRGVLSNKGYIAAVGGV